MQVMTMTTNAATTTLTANDRFEGDFDFLPFLSNMEVGPVPEFPTSDDFQAWAIGADESPARRWKLEAIRYRIQNPGAKLEGEALKAIATAVAKNLYRIATEAR